MDTYNEFSVGDYVTGYQKGIHRILRINERTLENDETCSPLVDLERVLSSSYKPSKGLSTCDILWCKKVDKKELIETLRKQTEERIQTIEKALV